MKLKGLKETCSSNANTLKRIITLTCEIRERVAREFTGSFELSPSSLHFMPSSTASSSLHTPSHPASSSSDYLLLTTESAPLLPSSSIPLPPPRFRPLLQIATVLDLSFTLIYGITRVELSKLPASAISLNLARPILVLWAISSVRVREMAPILLGQVIVSPSLFLRSQVASHKPLRVIS